MNNITKVAITRPVFIFMLMFAAFFMGYRSVTSMRVEENPEVSFGVVTVSTAYPGAGPEELNTLISRPVEEAISGVNGVYQVTALAQEGISLVTLNFNIGTDMDAALNDVRAKVDTVIPNLPEAALRPTVSKVDAGSSAVLTLGVKSKTLSTQELRDLIDDKIKDRFGQIPGVAAATVSGGDVREIQILLRKDALLAYKVGITEVTNAIRSATLNIPSGRVENNGQELTVRMQGEFATVDEIRDMRLKVNDPSSQTGEGQVVRLGDLAEVKDTVEERRGWSRLDGNDSVVITIQKIKEGNAIEIAKGALALTEQLQNAFPVEFVVTQNVATRISESLFDLQLTLVIGILLVTMIVYLFLHDWRGTLIVALAIPICLMATFPVMQLFGFTLNNMSLLALSLAIGVLVDDAIVVLENIYRHLKMGEEPVEAAINGRAEIGLAALAITFADVVVFIPVATMGGIVGQFFRPLGIGFVVAVLLSLFVSFTVTPMLASRWYRKGEDVEHPKGRFAQAFERTFTKFENVYRRALEWSLQHRWFVFISGFVVLIGLFMFIGGGFAPDKKAAIAAVTQGPMMMIVQIGVVAFIINLIRLRRPVWNNLIGIAGFSVFLIFMALAGNWYAKDYKKGNIFNFEFAPTSDAGQVTASIELPPGASLAETEKVVAQVEQVVMKHPDVKYTIGRVGTRGGGAFEAGSVGTNLGAVQATLFEKRALLDSVMFWVKHKERLRTKTDVSVSADLMEATGKIPGATVRYSTVSGFGFGAPIQMSFSGDDRAELTRVTDKIREGLAAGAIKGVISPQTSGRAGKPEIRAIPDRTRMADFGVTPAEVASSMRTLYEGDDNARFRVLGKEYKIRVQMSPEDRNNPEIIAQAPVRFVRGTPVFVSDVTTLTRGRAPDKIERRNRAEEIRVETNLLPGFAAGSVQSEIDAWLKKENLVPASIRQQNLGQADAQSREMGYLLGALGIGFLLVYLLLASLYNNLLYPLIIQLAQPQALVGALLALVLTDKAMNIVSFIGIITLVGLVGKNAILLVDYTNTLRERGKNRHDALVEAGPTRLRPIMMTSMAVVLGMLPVALAVGRGSEFRETLGITIIGGITLSTILTLLVIPCSYTILDDLSEGIGKVTRWISGRLIGKPKAD
ncbi:MAG: efflux RND transporter permease subunit [Chthonomonas sp.]|nr:efflux RND transporter permease subunit [Chthonomonas sp.]